MLNEKFTFCFKITIKWNLTNHMLPDQNQPNKYKTHVIKQQLFKWMSYTEMNQSHGLPYDETLFLSYQSKSKERQTFKALKLLSKNKSIIIQKASKDNTLAILRKCSYVRAIEERKRMLRRNIDHFLKKPVWEKLGISEMK